MRIRFYSLDCCSKEENCLSVCKPSFCSSRQRTFFYTTSQVLCASLIYFIPAFSSLGSAHACTTLPAPLRFMPSPFPLPCIDRTDAVSRPLTHIPHYSLTEVQDTDYLLLLGVLDQDGCIKLRYRHSYSLAYPR